MEGEKYLLIDYTGAFLGRSLDRRVSIPQVHDIVLRHQDIRAGHSDFYCVVSSFSKYFWEHIDSCVEGLEKDRDVAFRMARSAQAGLDEIESSIFGIERVE